MDIDPSGNRVKNTKQVEIEFITPIIHLNSPLNSGKY